jgi:hypothetical protein
VLHTIKPISFHESRKELLNKASFRQVKRYDEVLQLEEHQQHLPTGANLTLMARAAAKHTFSIHNEFTGQDEIQRCNNGYSLSLSLSLSLNDKDCEVCQGSQFKPGQ